MERACRLGRAAPSFALVMLIVLAIGCARSRYVSPPAFTKKLDFAILEDYDKGEDLSDVEKDFALFDSLGIHTWRGSFGWDDYEPARGRYDFDWLERFCALAGRHRLTLRPYVGYTPEWAAVGRRGDGNSWNDPPARLADWRSFVRALAVALRDHRNIASYEIYNEENVKQWWDGSAAEYSAVLAAAAGQVHAVVPGTDVVMGGMVWPDVDWVESVGDAACDSGVTGAIAFHAYPETWTPDSVHVENYLGPSFASDFVATADTFCHRRPVWVNEAGFAAAWKGHTERDQAAWWVRAIATFAAAPRISEIGVYEIKDPKPGTAVIGDAANFHLGLCRADRSKKMAFGVVKAMVELLGEDSIRVEGDPQVSGNRDSVVTHRFGLRSGSEVLVVWSLADHAAVGLPRGWRGVRELGLDGRWLPIRATPARLDLARAREPRVFVFDGPRH